MNSKVLVLLGAVLVGGGTSIFAVGGLKRAAITRPKPPGATNAVPQTPSPIPVPERRYLSPPTAESTIVPLAPGVYETRPYTCIVVIPGPHPDEKSIFPQNLGPDPSPRLPLRVPDLEFVPRQSTPQPQPSEKPGSKP